MGKNANDNAEMDNDKWRVVSADATELQGRAANLREYLIDSEAWRNIGCNTRRRKAVVCPRLTGFYHSKIRWRALAAKASAGLCYNV